MDTDEVRTVPALGAPWAFRWATRGGAVTTAALIAALAAGATVAQAQPTPEKPTAADPARSAPAPAQPSASGQPAAGGEAAPGLSTSDEAYRLRIKSLEEKVNDLKEKIFRSKARLLILQETVLAGVISGAKARIVHRNDMGSSFRLESVQYALDGAPIFQRTDVDGELAEEKEIEIFNSAIVPGNHNVSVYMVYRGHGFGVFSYLEGFKFKIKSSYTFHAEEGKVTTVNVVGYEKEGLTIELKDRPSVRYDVDIKREAPREGGKDTEQPPPAVSADDARPS